MEDESLNDQIDDFTEMINQLGKFQQLKPVFALFVAPDEKPTVLGTIAPPDIQRIMKFMADAMASDFDEFIRMETKPIPSELIFDKSKFEYLCINEADPLLINPAGYYRIHRKGRSCWYIGGRVNNRLEAVV